MRGEGKVAEESSLTRERPLEAPDLFVIDRPDPLPSPEQAAAPGKAGSDFVEADHTEQMVRLLTKYQDELFRYIFGLLPNEEDAKDVLQETSVSLYRKSAEYEPGKPFLAWAYRFAYLEVLKQRERNQRGTRHLRADLIERLARERERHDPVLHVRLHALDHCLEQLPAADRELIGQHYHAKTRIEEMVHQVGTSRRTLFRNLERIRRLLFECVNRRVAATS